MKKSFTCGLSLLLAVLMAVLSPIQTFAAADVEYISEIRIGYGDAGKKQLEGDGYIVWEDLNANDGGTGSAVYLGYKTTERKEEAITDLAAMPMDSGYSFDAYTEEMENLNKQIDAKLERFDDAIEEFRANYKKSAPYNDYALRAYTMLNMYVEDDTGLGLGDLFVRDLLDETDKKENGASTGTKLKQVYHNIFMMGNSVAVSAIETALAMGCTETDGETFLDRLEKAIYTDDIDASKNESTTTVVRAVEVFRDELRDATAARELADAYEGGRDAYIQALIDNDEDATTVLGQISLLEIMEDIDYGDVTDVDGNQLSFYDVMMLPTSMEEASQLTLTTQLLFMLADTMTPGQVAITETVGLSMLIKSADSTKSEKIDGTDGVEHFDLTKVDECLKQVEQTEKVSVYIGVDRTVFNDYETIAITSEAIRENAKSSEIGTVVDYKSTLGYVGLASAGCAVALASAVVAIHGFGARSLEPMTMAEALKHAVEETAKESKNVYNSAYKTVWSSSGKVMAIGGCICAAIGIAVAIYGFIQAAKTAQPSKIEYTAIPRAIIDVKYKSDGEGLYFVYYAARLAGASDDYKNEKDTTKLYGDLNGLDGYSPWLCLYYAKDMRIGSPITPTYLVKSSANLSGLQTKSYVPVHDFNNNTLIANNTGYTAINLNNTSHSNEAKEVYFYLKRDLTEPALTSSIVDEESSFNWISIATFFIGAGLATGACFLVGKSGNKKKVKEQQ